VGHLEPANAVSHRAGKSPFAVTKEFAFQQVFGNGRTVDGHKMSRGTMGLLVQSASHQFFARPTFSCDEHSGSGAGHPGD
jgi:hypothetical protein